MKQDIEASVIGGLLIGGLTPTASDVLATLEPEAFSIPLYRKAFEVIRKQARNRNLIDALMVAEACGEEHFTSILMTSKNCPSAANLKGYAGMVADNYHRRLVLEIMDEMREPIQSGTIDASSQAMDELVKRLSAIRKPRDEVKPVRLGEIITDYTDTLDRRLRNGEESDTLKTGIEELDAITGGMNAEDLVIIAARPGMGKTELALKIAEGVASRVIPGSDVRRGVLIFSMEMSALQIAERSIANAGRMSVSVLRNPASMDDEGWARVANGMSQLADLDVWVVGLDSRLTTAENDIDYLTNEVVAIQTTLSDHETRIDALEYATTRKKSEVVYSGVSVTIPTAPTNLVSLLKTLTPSSGTLAPFFDTVNNKMVVFNENKTLFFKLSIVGTWPSGTANRSMQLTFPGSVPDTLVSSRNAATTTDNILLATFFSVDKDGFLATNGSTLTIQSNGAAFTATTIKIIAEQ